MTETSLIEISPYFKPGLAKTPVAGSTIRFAGKQVRAPFPGRTSFYFRPASCQSFFFNLDDPPNRGTVVSIVLVRCFAPDIGHAQLAPAMQGAFYETTHFLHLAFKAIGWRDFICNPWSGQINNINLPNLYF
jgi:hypothetical protein